METDPDDLVAAVRAILEEAPAESLEGALTRWQAEGAAEAANDLGTALIKLGHKGLAERAYQIALELGPELYKPHNNLGNLLLERGEAAAAVSRLRRAAELAPDQPRVWLNLGNALVAAGQEPLDAAAAFERSAAIAPTWKALHNLGALLAQIGMPERAISAFERAVEIEPSALGSWISLAEVLTACGRRDEAKAIFRQVAARAPRDPSVLANLISTFEKHYYDEVGLEVCEQALDLWPFDETILLLYVFLLERNDMLERAEKRFLAHCDEAPSPALYLHLARLRARQSRSEDEAELIARAERRFPGHLAVLAQKARKLRHQGRLDEAISTLEQLAARQDCTNDVLEALGWAHLDVGDAASSFAALKRAEQVAPSEKLFGRSMLAFVSNAVDGLDAEEISRVHRKFLGAKELALPRIELPPRPLERERRLRVGYVSPDFRTHSVGMFIEPILMAHDRERFEVWCYSSTKLELDSTTDRIRALDLKFRDVKNLSDFALAQRVAADRIDILVDLSGWTAEQRLAVFRMQPCPIRVAYLGYPNTTGLPEMQYRITDSLADPVGADRLYVEKLVRLPRCAWAFDLVRPPPDVAVRPPARPLTFGSFNNLQKTTATTLDLWARILQRVPDARLLLKSKQLEHERARARILGELSARGIDAGRIELRERTKARRDHLEAYGDLDIALDTFPYNGTTTTCEALTMGVPVVTLSGETPASRVGRSLLTAVGLNDLVCADPSAYIEAAARLADDRARLEELRRTLRHRLATSELGDAVGLTRAIEAAYRRMWHEWLDAPRD